VSSIEVMTYHRLRIRQGTFDLEEVRYREEEPQGKLHRAEKAWKAKIRLTNSNGIGKYASQLPFLGPQQQAS
jgi:hypothetical protein